MNYQISEMKAEIIKIRKQIKTLNTKKVNLQKELTAMI